MKLTKAEGIWFSSDYLFLANITHHGWAAVLQSMALKHNAKTRHLLLKVFFFVLFVKREPFRCAVPFPFAMNRFKGASFVRSIISLSRVLITANGYVLISTPALSFWVSTRLLAHTSAKHKSTIHHCSWQLDKLTMPLSIAPFTLSLPLSLW